MAGLSVKEANGIEYLYVDNQYCGRVGDRAALDDAFRRMGQNVCGMVFISHSSIDKEDVKSLRNLFASRGIFPYVAEETFTIGQRLPDKIIDAIKSSDLFIIVLTKNSVKSPWVNAELGMWYSEMKTRGDYPIAIFKEADVTSEEIPEIIRTREHTIISMNDLAKVSEVTEEIKKTLQRKQAGKVLAGLAIGALFLYLLSKAG